MRSPSGKRIATGGTRAAPGLSSVAAAVFAATLTASAQRGWAQPSPTLPAASAEDRLAGYFAELARTGLVDAESGDKKTLTRELAAAETLLRDGDPMEAAVALFAIVESPRYEAFRDFVEYQNAEYDLAVALTRAGATGRGLQMLERILRRGPSAPYWGPAHRRAVDLAIATRDYQGVLARLEAISTAEPIPPSASGERAYLRGRGHYERGQFPEAEQVLTEVSKKSRLYSSALYLRGVMKTRRGEWARAAEAMCEIADTPDNDRFTFVVDDRYFTVKDLARLGLGRLAHEQGEYDDAYYHYLQIPEDSTRIADALFEAAWSMYQKRELGTARDLARELLTKFPSAPTWPEATLLAGYVELADCKFDDSGRHYDRLVAKLEPIVREMDRIRKNPDARRVLFERALARDRAADGAEPAAPQRADSLADEVLALLKLEPAFLRLSDTVTGVERAQGEAVAVVSGWQRLARQVSTAAVAASRAAASAEEEQAQDAIALAEDFRHLQEQIKAANSQVVAARSEGTLEAKVANDEQSRLSALAAKVGSARTRAEAAARAASDRVVAQAAPGLRPWIAADLAAAQELRSSAGALQSSLAPAAERLAQRAVDRLYTTTRRVLDKAKLGKIDAVIGQKRKLDIEVSDLAAGRMPPELHGRLWEAGLIGDDEEFWPFEGEFWADEYEGFR